MDTTAEKAVALNGGDATPAPMEVWRTLRAYPCVVLNAVILFSPLERKSGAGESTDSPAPVCSASLLGGDGFADDSRAFAEKCKYILSRIHRCDLRSFCLNDEFGMFIDTSKSVSGPPRYIESLVH